MTPRMLRAKKAITIQCGISAGVSNGSSTAERTMTPRKAPNQRVASLRLENSSAPRGAVNDHNTIPLEGRNPPRLSWRRKGSSEPERELGGSEEAVPLRLREDDEVGDAHSLVGEWDGGRQVETQCPVRPDPHERHERGDAREEDKRLLAQFFLVRVRRECADPRDTPSPAAPAFRGRRLHAL